MHFCRNDTLILIPIPMLNKIVFYISALGAVTAQWNLTSKRKDAKKKSEQASVPDPRQSEDPFIQELEEWIET